MTLMKEFCVVHALLESHSHWLRKNTQHSKQVDSFRDTGAHYPSLGHLSLWNNHCMENFSCRRVGRNNALPMVDTTFFKP